MKILSVEQMVRVDRLSTERCGIPSLLLMENAGAQLFESLQEVFGDDLGRKKIGIVCGKGNNGGDGLVLARQLAMRGISRDVYLLGKTDDVGGDAGINLNIYLRSGERVVEVTSEEQWEQLASRLIDCDIIVDAILGTGLSKPLTGLYSEAVSTIDESRAFVVAVDIPSGMFSDSQLGGVQTVRADLTVTFTAPKIAHVLSQDQEAIGVLRVAPIGSPRSLLETPEHDLNLMELAEIGSFLPSRKASSHKGTYGHVAVLAGSRGKAGAAALGSWAALRSGSGLVTACVPEPAQSVVASFRPEVMTEGFPATPAGTFSADSIGPLLEFLEGKDAAAIGPGLTTDAETVSTVHRLVNQARLPLVIDADGLNAFAGRTLLLANEFGSPLVATPHPGEFARLTGLSTHEILTDAVSHAQRFAREHQVWLVLKGFRTLVAEPAGQAYVCPHGNPGMATAGMGDVLTGVLTSCLGQYAALGRLAPEQITQAVCLGVFLHALAGDLAAEETGQPALTAADVTDHLGSAFDALTQDEF